MKVHERVIQHVDICFSEIVLLSLLEVFSGGAIIHCFPSTPLHGERLRFIHSSALSLHQNSAVVGWLVR